MPMGSWTLRFLSPAVLAVLLSSLPALGAGGPAHLVADLDPGTSAFDPTALPRFSSYTAVAGRVIFFSFLPEGDPDQRHTQCALWETDGSGVERLADLCGGTAAIDPAFLQLRVLATTGSVAFFTDPSGALWRTDATAAGTFPLGGGTLEVPPNNGIPPNDSVLGPDGRTLFYDACTAEEGCELWASDGTRAGTRQIPLVPGPDGADPAAFKAAGGRVFFVTGDQLWSSDGTPAGTVQLMQAAGPIQEDFLPLGNSLYFIFNAGGMDTVSVLDLRSGQATNLGAFPTSGLHLTTSVGLHTAGGRVLFTVYSPGRVALWETDGTRAGTHRIVPAAPFTSRADAFFGVGEGGGRLVFAAGQGEDSQYREQLWVLDRGSRRPRLLRSFPYAAFDLVEAALFKGRLFFTGQDPQGFEPWETDGTPAGTRVLKRLAPGPLDGIPAQFRVFAGSLVITTQKGDLWRTDGTPAGTVRLAGGAAGAAYQPLDAAPLGARIVFSGLDPAGGLEPFVSDLTPAGTRPIAEIGSSLAASSHPSGLAALGAKVLFASCKGATGALRVSDGTRAGTFPLPGTTVPCSPSPPPVSFERAGDLAFFLWKGELWRTDGTRQGTRALAAGSFYDGVPLGDRFLSARQSPAPAPPNDFAAVFGLLDGAGLLSSFTVHFGFRPEKLVSAGNEAFFIGREADSPFSQDFWRTDGTAAGTYPLLTGVESFGGLPPEVVRLGDRTCFTTSQRSGVGQEIWSTDGTAAGTAPLLPFPYFSFPFDLVAFHGRLYFFAVSGPPSAPIFSLFFSDGTPEGTHFLHNFALPAGGTGPFGVISPQLTVIGDQLFFRADDGVHGTEIWKTDGTLGRLAMVKDVNSGPEGSLPGSLTAAGGKLYFAATDGEHGVELWQSDGTEAGTTLVEDLQPGPAPSNPEQLTGADGILYFTADDGVHGREPWVLPLPR
jgi:ELWxxDGT repeat protein